MTICQIFLIIKKYKKKYDHFNENKGILKSKTSSIEVKGIREVKKKKVEQKKKVIVPINKEKEAFDLSVKDINADFAHLLKNSFTSEQW